MVSARKGNRRRMRNRSRRSRRIGGLESSMAQEEVVNELRKRNADGI